MKLRFIDTGFFKLDGGAMFGIVPRQLWQRLHQPDENNMCTWAMRCLLVETPDRKILVDTGIGNKQDDKFRAHFEPHGTASLESSLAQQGLTPDDITDVLLTHLHFDHVGGAVTRTPAGDLVPTFPNAVYWSNQRHYDWACNPNPREKASFLKENFVPLREAGVLKMIDFGETDQLKWLPGIELRLLFGHTEAMMMPILTIGAQRYIYTADLLPSSFHLGMPYVMSYDVRPLITLQEKERLLREAVEKGDILLFEHDPHTPGGRVVINPKGKHALEPIASLD